MKRCKKGQVWIETVIYTLIIFVIIGLTLAFVKPEIEKFQDKLILDQSSDMLKELNTFFNNLDNWGSGNQRVVDLGIKKGSVEINCEEDLVVFEMESRSTYSEPGKNIQSGDLTIHTEKKGKINIVTLSLNYTNKYDLQYQGEERIKKLGRTPTPYRLSVANKGGNPTVMDINI